MIEKFKGIIPPLVTPFDEQGEVSEPGLRRVISHVLEAGCTGVFVGGSQGEFFSMEPSERIRVFEIAVDACKGKYPVFAGTAAVTTKEAVALAQAAEKSGCDAVSVITPYFITPNGEELYEHYKAIAGASRLPVLLYNNPDRTGYKIPVNIIKRLAEIDTIIGMKDSSGDLTYVNDVLREIEGFMVYCGRDTVIFNELASGCAGAVPATGNVAPKLVVKIYNQFMQGNLEKAKKAQFDLAPLRNTFALGSFPVVMKEALNIMGIEVGGTRPPILPMTEENREKLKAVLSVLGLL